jgi:hypothetical protein
VEEIAVDEQKLMEPSAVGEVGLRLRLPGVLARHLVIPARQPGRGFSYHEPIQADGDERPPGGIVALPAACGL